MRRSGKDPRPHVTTTVSKYAWNLRNWYFKVHPKQLIERVFRYAEESKCGAHNDEHRKNKNLPRNYVEESRLYMEAGKNIIWLDEINFHLFCPCTQGCGAGCRAAISLPASKVPNINVIGAISAFKVIKLTTLQRHLTPKQLKLGRWKCRELFRICRKLWWCATMHHVIHVLRNVKTGTTG